MISFRQFKFRQFVWLFSVSIALGLIIGSYQYHFFDPSMVARRRSTSTETFPWVFIHVASGTMWLLSGLIQFTGIFLKDLKKHRINGRIYLVSVFLSTLSLIVINFKLQSRSPFGFGPYPGSLYAIICVISAWYFIRKKNVEYHRAWMMRSLAPAMVMPLDRFNFAFESWGLVPLEFGTLKLICFITIELLIFRKMDFDLIPSKDYRVRVIASIFLFFVCLCAFILTFGFEYKFVNRLIYPAS